MRFLEMKIIDVHGLLTTYHILAYLPVSIYLSVCLSVYPSIYINLSPTQSLQ
jgi:hypothetical protein